jgi:hypothetical protein
MVLIANTSSAKPAASPISAIANLRGIDGFMFIFSSFGHSAANTGASSRMNIGLAD